MDDIVTRSPVDLSSPLVSMPNSRYIISPSSPPTNPQYQNSSPANTVSVTNVKSGVSLSSYPKFVVPLVNYSNLTIKILNVFSRVMLLSVD